MTRHPRLDAPRWIRAGARAIPRQYRAEIVADLLDERARQIARGRSQMHASIWLAAELIRSTHASRQQSTHPTRGDRRMHAIAQDITYALRYFRRRPAFTAIALITLTLGIGTNLAAFAIINATLLRPLPFPNPDAVVRIFENDGLVLNPANYLDMRDGTHEAFSHFAAYRRWSRSTVTGLGTPFTAPTADTSPELFGVMGVAPLLGRTLTTDDVATDAKVIVLAHRMWRTRFDRDPAILGRTLTMDGTPWTIVGVMPEGIALPDVDLWRPLVLTVEQQTERGSWFLDSAARLRPGVDLARANVAVKAVMAGVTQADTQPHTATVVGLLANSTSAVRDPLLFAQGITAVVLLIACANLANLLLASFSTRRTEIVLRTSLGASRGRIVRQMVVESIVLAGLGAVIAIALATWLVPVIVGAYPGTLPRRQLIGVSAWEWVFALGLAAVTALICSLLPAVAASRPAASRALSTGGRATAGLAGRWLRPTLLVAEVALALTLLTGAGLLIRSLSGLTDQSLGFQPDDVMTTEIILPPNPYEDPAPRVRFFQTLFDQLNRHPAVAAASGSSVLPFDGSDMGMALLGEPVNGKAPYVSVSNRTVTPDYLQAMAIPLQRGRFISATDTVDSTPVAVVNEAFVKKYAATTDVFSLRVRRTATLPWLEIVGVVGDARQTYDRPARPEMYFPVTQMPVQFMRLAIRLRQPAPGFAGDFQRIVQSVDPNLAVGSLRTYDAMMASSIATRRFNRALLLSIAALAAVLAAVGIYGVMSYTVTMRRREVGVRLALGARPQQVVGMVVRQGLAPIILGLALGLAGAWWLTSLLTSQLYGVTPHDPWTMAGATLLFFVIGLLACWIPARRTSRVDPVSVLRAE